MKMRQITLLCIILQGTFSAYAMQKAASIPQSLREAISRNISAIRNYDWKSLYSYPNFGEGELSIYDCLDSRAREGFRNDRDNIKQLWNQPERLKLVLALLQNKVKWVSSDPAPDSGLTSASLIPAPSVVPGPLVAPSSLPSSLVPGPSPSVAPSLPPVSLVPPGPSLLPQPPRARGLIGLIDSTLGVHSYVHNFFNTISHAVATNFNLTPEGIKKLGEAVADLVKDANSPGHRFLTQASEAFGNLVRDGGELRRTVNDAVSMVGDLARNGGELRRAADDGVRMVRDLMDEGGEVRAAMATALETFREGAKDFNADLRIATSDLTETYTEAVKEVTDVIHDQADKFMTTGKRHFRDFTIITVGGLVVVFTAYHGSRVLMNYLDRYLMIPKLVLESSEKSLWEKVTGIFSREKELPELIFSPELKSRLDNIIAATQNIRAKIEDGQTNVKYRNLLLWGPPGTGKTLFAKTLAIESGMAYAMMSGSSFAQFKDGQGITEMNKLFEWAQRSKNGLLLFIDEAESFLGGREGQNVTDESYQLLTNFLNHTGERSDKFMIVFATNHRELIDKAMGRRIDDSVEVTLPTQVERTAILELYRKKILLDDDQNSEEFVDSVDTYLSDKDIERVAQRTEGLSGGELEGIINSIITDAAITDTGLVTKELIDMVVNQAVQKHREFAGEFNGTVNYAAAAA